MLFCLLVCLKKIAGNSWFRWLVYYPCTREIHLFFPKGHMARGEKPHCGMAVVVKAVLGSHFGVGAPPILVYLSGGWDSEASQGCWFEAQASEVTCSAPLMLVGIVVAPLML